MSEREKGIVGFLRGGKEKEYILRSLLYTFLLGFFAHGFMFFNLNISHDALFDFYDGIAAHQHQIGLGRIFEPLYREMTASNLLMPWSVGIMALFWLGLAVFLVCRLFHLSGRMEIFLTAGIMTVNISVTAVAAAYLPWLSADMLALLLAVAGVSFWRLYGENSQKKYLAYGVLAMIFSLGIYQCYLAVAVELMILVSVQGILEKADANKVFRDGMAGIGMLAVSGAIYYVLMKVVTFLVGTPLAEGYYDSVTNLWDNQESVLKRLVACIKEGVTHFFAKDENIYPYPVVWMVNIVLLCICAVLVWRLVRQERGRLGAKEWLLILLLAAALPFAANMMRLLNVAVHDLMSYSVWLLYLLPILLWKWVQRGDASDRRIRAGIVALLCFVIFSYGQTDNAIYVKKEVESKATLSLMTEIMTQVGQTEGYVQGETPITFVGHPYDILQTVPETERVQGISGNNKSSAITYEGTFQAYFDNVLLRDVTVVFDGDTEKKEEVREMPAYPQTGYVKMVDGEVVVKLR